MVRNFSQNPLITLMERIPTWHLKKGEKLVVFSDLHMGGGGRADDLLHNGQLLKELLGNYYLPRGYNLVLNGDVEELQRFPLSRIREQWRSLYEIFDAFNQEDRLYKILGNHDEVLRFVPNKPYQLYDGLKIDTGSLEFHIYHGHQSMARYERASFFIGFLLRYIATPLGIRNIANRRRIRQRFAIEKAAYDYSLEQKVVSIIGHTHRSLFESLSRYDIIKFEIEGLCRNYTRADEQEQAKIEQEVLALRHELEKLTKKQRRTSLHPSLYGNVLPVPCLFNSGNCIGKKGINCIELDSERISLIYWYHRGASKKFVQRGGYSIEKIENSDIRKVVLNTDKLKYIAARIRLLS